MKVGTNNRHSGLVLAELLMAIWVMSIILAAVATLSFALSSANDTADNTSEIYSRIRYTTVWVSELFRNCKLVCANFGSSAAIWQADNNGDNQINPGEIVYIEIDSNSSCVKAVSFQPAGAAASTVLTISDIASGQARAWLNANCPATSVTLLNNCSSLSFATDCGAPRSRRFKMFFDISQNGVVHNYQITDCLRCVAANLLDPNGQIDSVDDD